MKPKKKNAHQINSRDEYLKLFPKNKKVNSKRMRFKALKEAQDIRKFEIELYWKRTGFFWAFITITYTALFAVLCKYIECPSKYSFFIPVISALSGLGFLFSVAWHMVNKGSKFWQKNWETHVSLLEKSEIGPLYDVFLNPNGSCKERWCPIKAFDFSVTKVNMWLSFIMIILSFLSWGGLLVFLFLKPNYTILTVLAVIIPGIIVLIIAILMMIFSDGNKNIVIVNEEPELDMIYIITKDDTNNEN